ncbi:MAG: tryptophan--tRNA ligase [Acidobacteria bacterium]|nr:tryptophan--tRNA ligase [Acidobacteriota bacterium]
MKKRIFSGAQPTGELHIGNYLGALKNWVALQDEYESFFCIVNLHAITLPQDPTTLRQKTLDLARIYLAAGIDPQKSTIFIQSDVPEHAELTWILSCIARMGELERMTQFKEKARLTFRGEPITFRGANLTYNAPSVGVGLFTYPLLMASDILLYQTDLVPVGQDQKQHLELSRDLAERFNRDFGQTFKVPEPFIPPVGANIKSLQDPAKKMSKSDENASGSIFLLDDRDTVTKKIKRAVTDSGTDIRFDETRPAVTNLLTIFQILTGKSPQECEDHFAGKGYGQLKTELADTVVEFLRPFQEKVKQYDDATLDTILKPGAERARVIAAATLKNVYERMGIN